MAESRYLRFDREDPPGRRTPIVWVFSKSRGDHLGTIAWHGPWRQFCFFPQPETLFNVGCMTDIQDEIAELRAERKK